MHLQTTRKVADREEHVFEQAFPCFGENEQKIGKNLSKISIGLVCNTNNETFFDHTDKMTAKFLLTVR